MISSPECRLPLTRVSRALAAELDAALKEIDPHAGAEPSGEPALRSARPTRRRFARRPEGVAPREPTAITMEDGRPEDR